MKYLVIPTEWLDSDLTYREMIVLAELVNLSQGRKCTASNEYLADTLKISRKNVSNVIASLQSKGYITSKVETGTRNKHREIIVNYPQNECPQKVDTVSTNRGRVSTKSGESKERNKERNKENNPPISPLPENPNGKSEEKSPPPNPSYPEALQEWIDYRKEIRKPLKPRTIDKLLKDYEADPEMFRKKVEFSIASGYQGLFAPKGGAGGQRSGPPVGSLHWELEEAMRQQQSVVDTEVVDE